LLKLAKKYSFHSTHLDKGVFVWYSEQSVHEPYNSIPLAGHIIIFGWTESYQDIIV